MTKAELVKGIAERAGVSQSVAETCLNAFTAEVKENLAKGETIQLVGFGTFEVAERAARDGRNPSTGEKIKIAASKAPKFKPGKTLKEAVNS